MTTNELRTAIHSILAGAKDGMHVDDIALALIEAGQEEFDVDTLKSKISNLCAGDSKKPSSDIMRVINGKTRKPKKGMYKLRKRKNQPNPTTPCDTYTLFPEDAFTPTSQKTLTTTYIGKAGECAVMSELLYQGFNVNTLLVDEGVDVVASKNNEFFLVQVKTTILENGSNNNCVRVQIRKARFDAYRGYQIRYVVVVRCNYQNRDTNLFFTFDNQQIELYMHNGCILRPTNDMMSIKIKFGDGMPYLYHGDKEADISFHQNNFNW